MKKILGSILIILITTTVALSQEQCSKEVFAKIHAAKIVYITDSIKLTADQSEKFIPAYEEYEKDIRETRRNFFKKYKGTNAANASDGASLQYIDDNLDYQEQIIEIKRKYNDRFLKIITPQQLTRLYKAEREFKQMLMKRYYLRQEKNGGKAKNMSGSGF